jgi:hypothetical protein
VVDPKLVNSLHLSAKKATAVGFVGIVLFVHGYGYFHMMDQAIPAWFDISFMALLAFSGLATVVFGVSKYAKRESVSHDIDG